MRGFKFKKIRHRVFFSIFLALTALITVIFAFQIFYLDDWYLGRKVAALEKGILKVAESIESMTDYEEDLYLVVDRFEEENNAMIQLVSTATSMNLLDIDYEEIAYPGEGAVLVVKDDAGMFYYIAMGDLGLEEDVDYLDQIGETFYVLGEKEADFIYPIQVNDDFTEAFWEDFPEDAEDLLEDRDLLIQELYGEGISVIDGQVTLMEIIGSGYEELNIGYEAYEKENYEVIEEGFTSFWVYQPFSNILTAVFEKEVTLMDGTPALIYVEASLQSIEEAMTAMVPFFVAFYVLSFIVVLMLASYLSAKITGPIVTISAQTERLAQQDFSARVAVTTEDELGHLAGSINRMTDSLEASLQELQEANDQLLVDIEKERLLEQQRRDFVANASHELKTPLGIAKGYLEAILDGIRKDKQDDYLKIAMAEMDRMNRIVLNMLELMKLEEGQNLVLEPRSLKPYLDEMERYFDVRLLEKDMTLRVDVGDDPVMLESNTMRSLLMNLISNAVNYGVSGTEIMVSSKIGDNVSVLTISNVVEDPESIDTDLIWHKFHTGDRSHNRKRSGTGLGLSIVKGILDQYGATSQVTVQDNRFTIRCYLHNA